MSYTDFSYAIADLPSAAGCFIYEPDNHDDYRCLAVWQPAPELGARTWTRNGKRIMLALYRDEGKPGVSDTHVIFRLLPTFKPVPWQVALDIIAAANPEVSRHTVALTDVVTGQVQLQSEVQTFTSGETHRRYQQQLNELARPMRQDYDARGQVLPPDLRFTKHDNAPLHLTVPWVDQYGGVHASNAWLPVYDYYGMPINEPVPTVMYDSNAANGISSYTGPLHDVFGDYVIGARANNTVITRQPVQPIRVDHHNKPLKRPSGRG